MGLSRFQTQPGHGSCLFIVMKFLCSTTGGTASRVNVENVILVLLVIIACDSDSSDNPSTTRGPNFCKLLFFHLLCSCLLRPKPTSPSPQPGPGSRLAVYRVPQPRSRGTSDSPQLPQSSPSSCSAPPPPLPCSGAGAADPPRPGDRFLLPLVSTPSLARAASLALFAFRS